MTLDETRSHAERAAIARALPLSAHNVSQAAQLLGVSRRTLYRLLERYRITAGEIEGRIALSTHLDREDEPVAGAITLRANEGVIVEVA